ncbi:MAG: hypothetical protein QMC37_11535 [Flavobacteriales bacterium]
MNLYILFQHETRTVLFYISIMIERERLVVKMEAGAPLLFIIGKLDSEMAFLAKTFGYVVVCGVPPKTGGKYIQLF